MRIFRNLIGLVFLLLAGSACQEETPKVRFRIGFSQCCDDAWRDVMNGEMQRELIFYPEIDFQMKVAGNDSETQVRQIDSLVKSGIDLLLVSPNESRPLTPIIEEVYRQGIPVILIDRATTSSLYTAYIGADNYEVGQTAGYYLSSLLSNGQAAIIEIQLPKSISPSIERNRGFAEAIAGKPNLEVVASLEAVGGVEDVESQLPVILAEHPEANVIYGHTDLLAETAYQIAQRTDRAQEMIFIGIDGIPGTGRGIQAVEDGILDASMLYPTGGGEAIRLAMAILNDLPYEKENRLETIVINQDNARILHNQMKKVTSLQDNIDRLASGLEALQINYYNQRIYLFVLLSSLCLALVLGFFLWRSLQSKQAALRALEEKNKEILAHEAQIIEMSKEIEVATQAKVDFFTNISHEFRTPLTLILGFAEDLLPAGKIEPILQQGVQHIRQNAYRLLRLVNQLLDFRKAESRQMQVRAAEHDLVAFVREIMEAYGKIAQDKRIDFQLLTRHEHLLLWFDATMLDKVLFNLLSNAFKYTPEGGHIHILLSVDKFENTAQLTVEDSGPGLQAEEMERIFDAFYQGVQHRQAGTGLGLYLSKLLVELHHGRIQTRHAPERGTQFMVTLPLGKDHFKPEELVNAADLSHLEEEGVIHSLADRESLPDAETMGSAPADRLILIIEDNPDLQAFLQQKLSSSYQLSAAIDGATGYQQALDLMPDLIICDINLPGMDGLQITSRLKTDLRTSHIPIILLSSRSTPEQQIEGMQAGADIYITKPFNVGILQAKIRSLLLNRQYLKESYGHQLQKLHVALPELPDHLQPIDRAFIRQFTTYIDEHYGRQDFQVTDLCLELGLSRSQLYRKVKALLGESIGSYIESVRLGKAELLLTEGRLSVADVAYEVGYSSPDYFSKVFKSKYGVTPSAFRKGE